MRVGLMSSRQPSKRNAGRAGQSQDAATPVVQVSPMNVDEENVDAAPLEAAQEAVAAMTMAASSTATPVAAQDTHDEAQPSNIQQPNTSAKSASVTTRQGNGKGKWKAKGRKGRKPGRSAAAGGKAQEKPVKTSGLGRGKGPRGGQSHKRARLDLGEEENNEVQNHDLDKLWTGCARQLQPLRRVDEAKLHEMEHSLLDNWGIDPETAREVAANFEGSWLQPTMNPQELASALMDLAPPERKKAPLGPLGRPYQDVWEEENFLSSLRGDEGDATGDAGNGGCDRRRTTGGGSSSQQSASSASLPSCPSMSASAGGTDPAGATGGSGERRSMRGGGRRSSSSAAASGAGISGSFGGGSAGGGGGGEGAGAGAGACGDGDSGSAGGAGNGGGRFYLPTNESIKLWTDIVPSHDQARFRRSLAAARQRLQLRPCAGFYTPKETDDDDSDGDSDDDSEEDMDERASRRKLDRRRKDAEVVALLERTPEGGKLQRASEGCGAGRVGGVGCGFSGGVGGGSGSGSGRQLRRLRPNRHTAPTGRAPANGDGFAMPVPPRRSLSANGSGTATPSSSASTSSSDASTSSASTTSSSSSSSSSGQIVMVPVWKGQEGNSILHPIRRPRKRYMSPAPRHLPPENATPSSRWSGGSLRSSGEDSEDVINDLGGGEDDEVVGDDNDEVCREIRRAWATLQAAEAASLHSLVELEGLCRQERFMFQNVWDRTSEAQAVLCSSLALAEQGKGIDRANKAHVGLSDDFPYHDPTEVPVIQARRRKKDAEQSLTWVQEETAGWSPTRAAEERDQRQAATKEAAKAAAETEEQWVPRRLSAGRPKQTGRGHGIPVPGGVAHPFLISESDADFLYSIEPGQAVEARDEWGVWSVGTVVAVRGEGGMCPQKDTNVLRAVKVSFQGWGAAMDVWLPVDSGMLARPGTHVRPKKLATTQLKRVPNRSASMEGSSPSSETTLSTMSIEAGAHRKHSAGVSNGTVPSASALTITIPATAAAAAASSLRLSPVPAITPTSTLSVQGQFSAASKTPRSVSSSKRQRESLPSNEMASDDARDRGQAPVFEQAKHESGGVVRIRKPSPVSSSPATVPSAVAAPAPASANDKDCHGSRNHAGKIGGEDGTVSTVQTQAIVNASANVGRIVAAADAAAEAAAAAVVRGWVKPSGERASGIRRNHGEGNVDGSTGPPQRRWASVASDRVYGPARDNGDASGSQAGSNRCTSNGSVPTSSNADNENSSGGIDSNTANSRLYASECKNDTKEHKKVDEGKSLGTGVKLDAQKTKSPAEDDTSSDTDTEKCSSKTRPIKEGLRNMQSNETTPSNGVPVTSSHEMGNRESIMGGTASAVAGQVTVAGGNGDRSRPAKYAKIDNPLPAVGVGELGNRSDNGRGGGVRGRGRGGRGSRARGRGRGSRGGRSSRGSRGGRGPRANALKGKRQAAASVGTAKSAASPPMAGIASLIPTVSLGSAGTVTTIAAALIPSAPRAASPIVDISSVSNGEDSSHAQAPSALQGKGPPSQPKPCGAVVSPRRAARTPMSAPSSSVAALAALRSCAASMGGVSSLSQNQRQSGEAGVIANGAAASTASPGPSAAAAGTIAPSSAVPRNQANRVPGVEQREKGTEAVSKVGLGDIVMTGESTSSAAADPPSVPKPPPVIESSASVGTPGFVSTAPPRPEGGLKVVLRRE